MTKISCIIPAWNAEKFIARSVASVLDQTRPVDEVIVVDDGSTDATAQIVEAIEGVTLLRQENAGVAAARNHGIKKATGNIICFNDADDLWMQKKLETQMKAIEKDSKLCAVFGMSEHRLVAGSQAESMNLALPVGLVSGRLIPNMLAKKEVFKEVGLFDEMKSTTTEQEWLLKLRESGLKEYTPAELTFIRQVHGDNMTLRLAHEKRDDYRLMMQKIMKERRAKGVKPQASWQHRNDD